MSAVAYSEQPNSVRTRRAYQRRVSAGFRFQRSWLTQDEHRRLEAFAESRGMMLSDAAAELIVAGLSYAESIEGRGDPLGSLRSPRVTSQVLR